MCFQINGISCENKIICHTVLIWWGTMSRDMCDIFHGNREGSRRGGVVIHRDLAQAKEQCESCIRLVELYLKLRVPRYVAHIIRLFSVS